MVCAKVRWCDTLNITRDLSKLSKAILEVLVNLLINRMLLNVSFRRRQHIIANQGFESASFLQRDERENQ